MAAEDLLNGVNGRGREADDHAAAVMHVHQDDGR